MRHVSVAELKGSTAIPLTREEKLLSVAKMFKAKGDKTYATVADIEGKTPEMLASTFTTGTVLEPVVRHLSDIGIPTEPNLASVMRSLELSQAELHDFACFCHHTELSGHTAHFWLAGKAGILASVQQDTERFRQVYTD